MVMHRERRDGVSSDYHHHSTRNAGAYGERRRNYSSRTSKRGSDRDYREHWVPEKPRIEQSRSRSPEPAMAGLIFMCNKKTQRRCLAYQVLGMPMAKKKLADQITPGMPLFLFEFESRELYGVYEAASRVGMDLEPKAFLEADIDFPLQVRFRVMHKCPPLREVEYKDAIRENYFEATRFKFILDKDQVSRLVKLFVSVESYDRLNTSRNLEYPYVTAPSSYDNNGTTDYRGLTTGTASSRVYPADDLRKDEHWRKDPGVFSKTPYYDAAPAAAAAAAAPPADYRKDDHWRKESELYSKASYVDAHRNLEYNPQNTAYVSEYNRYYEPAKQPGAPRYEEAAWPSRGEGYEYITSALEPLTSATTSVHHQAGLPAAAASYATLQAPKYDMAPGYGYGRPEVISVPTADVARYWKPEETVLQQQIPADPQYAKPGSVYSSRPLYSELGTSSIQENPYRIPSRKAVYPEGEYVPQQLSAVPAVAPLPVGNVQETGDYRGFSSTARKVPSYYGYLDEGPQRYSVSEPLPRDAGYVNGIGVQETSRERYRLDQSPRPGLVPEARYIPAPAPVRHHPPDREPRYAPEAEIGAYESLKPEDAVHYELQQQSPARGVNGRRSSPERYAQGSPERLERSYQRFARGSSPPERGFHRRQSVWDRVSVRRAQRMMHHGGYQSFRKRREYSPGLEDEDSGCSGGGSGEDEEYVVDFKRRNKSNQGADDQQANDDRQEETKTRKKRIVRPA